MKQTTGTLRPLGKCHRCNEVTFEGVVHHCPTATFPNIFKLPELPSHPDICYG